MSTKAVAWALEQDVGNPSAKLVLVGIAEHADRESWIAWPSRSTCALYAGCTPRSVTSHFRTLLEKRLLREVLLPELQGVYCELVERFESIPPDARPRLWLVNPDGAGGNSFQSRLENPSGGGGKPGGNCFPPNQQQPSDRTAGSNVPDAAATAALLDDYRNAKASPADIRRVRRRLKPGGAA